MRRVTNLGVKSDQRTKILPIIVLQSFQTHLKNCNKTITMQILIIRMLYSVVNEF